ncbi:hypothetical protein GUJ93_ZPchr0006g44945 [Zizania palustris]|uniref:Clp R domain-containing protein n=1 Tax=Zizania palustris TaxID=103762 RepID=A0A8J5T6W1_ZIZPA|nr:hypothetical protein GUJ93_ZPchr0006g44945 [Zizania palustris]
MRAGGYTVHQALSADAAAVLKLAMALARRRGHAQLTPLHVAFTLLRSSSSSSSSTMTKAAVALPSDPTPFACSADGTSCCAYGLLRRACVRAHPAAGACTTVLSHPFQCRALELCFNVALNRLPTTNVMVDGRLCSPAESCSANPAASSTSLSASLVQHDPTLSNALVAALKRAQANQRRSCIELQSLPSQPVPHAQQQQQQQQQPLLAIKVELDQLITSILDDPSVSRVMREAGFSSAAVKSSLEEESAMLPALGHHVSYSSSSSAPCVSPLLSLELRMDFNTHVNRGSDGGGSWPAQFLNQPATDSSGKEEDVRAILEVMVQKQGTRINPVVVGDSLLVAEASVAELMRRLERGDVPDELRGAHVLRLHLSYVHLRLMTRDDVDARVAELRRTANAIANAKAAGLVIYVGDIRWAVDDDDHTLVESPNPVEHMVAELARLLADLRAAPSGRAWVVAAASYQTYMRCQQRRHSPSLDTTWALQPVIVPVNAGTGLALGSRAHPAPSPSMVEEGGKITKVGEIPMLELAIGEDDGVRPVLCPDCADGYEKEASLVMAKAEGTTLALTYFPGWPLANEAQTSHEAELMELRRKWGSLCQRIHSHSRKDHRASNATPTPWWCTSSPNRDDEAQTDLDPSCAGLSLSFGAPADHGRSESNEHGACTTLSLLLPDSTAAAAAAATKCQDTRSRRSDGVDGVETAQVSDVAVDAATIRRLWLDELLQSGDLKRKGDENQLSSEPKRRRGGVTVDLNLCATDDDEDDGGDSDDEVAPSDLTNEGESMQR